MRKAAIIIMAAGACTLAGCESLITGGDLIREGLPTATLVFQNTSAQSIDTVLISTCEASSYGLDRLPSGVTVHPGQSYQWMVSAGCYDVMAGAVGVGSTPGQRINVPAGRRFVLNYDGQDR
jgi:hypothetical protein